MGSCVTCCSWGGQTTALLLFEVGSGAQIHLEPRPPWSRTTDCGKLPGVDACPHCTAAVPITSHRDCMSTLHSSSLKSPPAGTACPYSHSSLHHLLQGLHAHTPQQQSLSPTAWIACPHCTSAVPITSRGDCMSTLHISSCGDCMSTLHSSSCRDCMPTLHSSSLT